jgi:P-type E1-E2 ATPase
MIEIDIPGRDHLIIENLLLDLNGTIALDGIINPKVKEKINLLSQKLKIFILTADTLGSAQKITRGIEAKLALISPEDSSRGKMEFFKQFNANKTAVIGNGYNDHLILKEAILGIAVIGEEGASVHAMINSDSIVKNIFDALNLFIHPLRLKATLRR